MNWRLTALDKDLPMQSTSGESIWMQIMRNFNVIYSLSFQSQRRGATASANSYSQVWTSPPRSLLSSSLPWLQSSLFPERTDPEEEGGDGRHLGAKIVSQDGAQTRAPAHPGPLGQGGPRVQVRVVARQVGLCQQQHRGERVRESDPEWPLAIGLHQMPHWTAQSGQFQYPHEWSLVSSSFDCSKTFSNNPC